MLTDFLADAPLPYLSIKRQVSWRSDPRSGEYLVPAEDKPVLLQRLCPFAWIPGPQDTLIDAVLNERFVVRDFKVIRESEMNFIASPYYYRNGGTVLDWEPLQPPPPKSSGHRRLPDVVMTRTKVIVRVRPEAVDRYNELLERQCEQRRHQAAHRPTPAQFVEALSLLVSRKKRE